MAIDAAKQSEFLCASCSGDPFQHTVTYQFQFPTIPKDSSTLQLAPLPASRVCETSSFAFKLMWATARFWGYAEKNICEGIVLPTMNIPDKNWFTEEQMKHNIGEANEPYKSMFWICAETGSRGEELCAVKVEGSNLDQRVLKIRRSVWKGELQTTKSKKGLRTFAISSQLCEHLNPT